MMPPRMYGYKGCAWCCYFWLTEWHYLACGLSLDLSGPNIEFHLPCGFLRAGRLGCYSGRGTGWHWGHYPLREDQS